MVEKEWWRKSCDGERVVEESGGGGRRFSGDKNWWRRVDDEREGCSVIVMVMGVGKWVITGDA